MLILKNLQLLCWAKTVSSLSLIVSQKNSICAKESSGLIHKEVWESINGRGLDADIQSGRSIAGYASFIGDCLEMIDGDARGVTEHSLHKHGKIVLAKKFEWANAYIRLDSFIEEFGG